MGRDPYLELGDAARHAEAVASRSERRSRLERASETATWRGTLRDLAERRLPVTVRIDGGASRRGSLVAIGADHLALRAGTGQLVLLRLDAVQLVRPEPGLSAPVATGDRERVQGQRLATVLAALVEDRTRIQLGCVGLDEPVVGELVGLGEDVLTVEVDAADRGTVYLPLAVVSEVVTPL